VEVAIQRPGSFDTFAAYRLDAGLGGNIREQDEGVRPLQSIARFMTLARGGGTGVLLILFGIGWGFVAAKAARTEWQLVPLLAISLLVFWFGADRLIVFFQEDYTPAKFTTNPILPDVESVAIGKELYEQNCLACHGETGAGDGPTAAILNPPPADFSAGHTDTHPDGDLYYWIREGIEGTEMPAFGEILSEDEAWHLVNYVRRLSAQLAV
jgi:mono/diheme cytochrome c family protein